MLSKSGSRKCVGVPENSYSIADKYSFVADNFYCRDTMRRDLTLGHRSENVSQCLQRETVLNWIVGTRYCH
jgi:hypothetical protein